MIRNPLLMGFQLAGGSNSSHCVIWDVSKDQNLSIVYWAAKSTNEVIFQGIMKCDSFTGLNKLHIYFTFIH